MSPEKLVPSKVTLPPENLARSKATIPAASGRRPAEGEALRPSSGPMSIAGDPIWHSARGRADRRGYGCGVGGHVIISGLWETTSDLVADAGDHLALREGWGSSTRGSPGSRGRFGAGVAATGRRRSRRACCPIWTAAWVGSRRPHRENSPASSPPCPNRPGKR